MDPERRSSGTDNRTATKAAGVRWGRIALVIGGVVAVYLLGQALIDTIVGQLDLRLRARTEPMLHWAVMTAAAMYVVLMSVPFMPAVEIGLSMLVIFGGKIAFLVYVSTVFALTLAYLIGRYLPAELAAKAFGSLGLTRAQAFANRLAPLSGEERMALLMRESPSRLVPYLVRYRFVALAVLLNLPGNTVIGGGGGIAMLAGLTRLFPFPAYLVTILLAVAPVPLVLSLTA
jgi:hypothetical protein